MDGFPLNIAFEQEFSPGLIGYNLQVSSADVPPAGALGPNGLEYLFRFIQAVGETGLMNPNTFA
jgi:hypothetical protein